MATAAAALLEWEPLMQLQHTNFQLREENRALHWQVRELLDWKARAVRHMVGLAPKRSRAQREIRHATQLQQQLRAVETTLQDRGALEETAHLLERKQELLAQRVATLEREKQTLTGACEREKQRGDALAERLQLVGDTFRVHLEKLVALTGLTAVSDKCLRWFHDHVAQTFADLQERAARFETQHTELMELRQQVESVETERHAASATMHQRTQVAQITQLEHANAHLAHALKQLETHCVEHSHSQTQLGDQVRLLVTEVRQYLRLVRVEIKKKFGYVPEAIAHAESWQRILDALDALERHVRLANVAIASPRPTARGTTSASSGDTAGTQRRW